MKVNTHTHTHTKPTIERRMDELVTNAVSGLRARRIHDDRLGASRRNPTWKSVQVASSVEPFSFLFCSFFLFGVHSTRPYPKIRRNASTHVVQLTNYRSLPLKSKKKKKKKKKKSFHQ